jgi:arginyl-tRNA synthetase
MVQEALVRTLADATRKAAADLGLDQAELPEPELTRPRQKEHGDWATNVALVLASKAQRKPREVAQAIADKLHGDRLVQRVEVAGPGFINLFLGTGWLHDALRRVLEEGPAFGRAEPNGLKAQVEYVSANPTGPLHVGTARNAALGDAVANIFEAAGFTVEREYYFNDANRQVDLYVESVEARYLQHFGREAQVPEEGYHGPHVTLMAEEIASAVGDSLVDLPDDERRARIRTEAIERTMGWIRHTLERFHVHMDTWANEADFRKGPIDEAVARLREKGYVYEEDGALFFRATEFGDEKDRVVIRSNGLPTYFAADLAYLLHKGGRGFDKLVYVLGADHHGTVKRLLAAADALGVGSNRVQVLLYQLVHLYRGGEPVRMSRRAGDYVTLDELIDEVGPDAARYTLLARSPDSAIDFDIEAVKRQSMDNPVFYVQYAHARIASLLRKAEEQGVAMKPWAGTDLTQLKEEAELDLIRTLSEFPDIVATAAETLGPHRIARYDEEVAAVFHRFYTDHRVITDDAELTQARLWLSGATRQVIASALGLLGVTAPEAMERIGGDDG